MRSGGLADELWTSFGILPGLRFPQNEVETLMKGVISMEESSVYQAIYRKGLLEGEEIGIKEGR